MNITQLGHLAFTCRDLNASLHFYRDLLGFREKFRLYYGDIMGEEKTDETPEVQIKRKTPWIIYVELPGQVFIELFDAGDATVYAIPDGSQFNYQHLSLLVDDIFATQAELQEKGVEIDIAPSLGVDHTWQMWTHDPDGNKIEWMQYTDQSMQLIGR